MSDEMKRDIEKLKADVSDLRATNKVVVRTLVRIEAKVDAGLAAMATKDDISRLNGRMDRFAGIQSDRDFDMAKNRHRLDDHDRRLIELEERRA